MGAWPEDPYGDMGPILQASLEAAKARHPSGKGRTVSKAQPEAPSAILTAQDRCDRCGARAYYRVARDALTLDFCGHHADKASLKLIADGWSVVGVELI